MSGSAATAAEPPPLVGVILWIVALALATGTFMQVLDGTIANVSLPTIAGNLGISSDNGVWIITSFAVANGVTVPLTGWLMGRFGVVKTFCVSVTAFTLASLLCGIAWDLPSLILFRILQGACSGPMIPGSQALLLMIFPANKRALALSIWSVMTMGAPVLGPVLGGFISDHYHWGWIFLINVPVGIVVALISWLGLRTRDTPIVKVKFDTVGLILLAIWVFSLQVVLDLGKDRDWFHNNLIVALSCCAAVGFVAWVIWELTDRQPAVDLRLFKTRNFLLANIALALGYAVMFGNNLLLPLWLQQQMGYTATYAGLVAAPAGLMAVVLSPLLSRTRNLDSRIVATIAFLGYGICYLLRARYTPDASFWALTLPQIVQGVGAAMFFVPLLTIMLGGLRADQVPSASGLSNFVRITAGSFGASIITTLWSRRETLHQTRLVENANPWSPVYQQATDQMQAHGMTMAQANGSILRSVIDQSYLLASTEIFYVSGWISIALIAVVWFSRRAQPSQHVVVAD
ncbi:DHA2 family multidrug resistance protein [Sphingomonas vulcanisoli]|uniref:DHA2 family multidrug resistance protein n=1 Tax=Sphingomonas vulcanisoli TaxID=1658060 RepID=A0ABX0TW52_9SPHN|nr:DHA2 family efflux MFS transporter permease subunit [Sphingomonas vulcanisoli]NIJ08939.1 DHA2 family multidrug resistance protein [Sphingomonas vulcanisoli]